MDTDLAQMLFRPQALRCGVRVSSRRIIPIYWDSRRALSSAVALRAVAQTFANWLSLTEIDIIIGCETSGIGLAAVTAVEAGLPWAYVRKHAKGHSGDRMIEGAVKNGSKGVLIDDVIATGASKELFIQHARPKVDIRSVFVMLDDSGGRAENWLTRGDIELRCLFTFDDLYSAVQKIYNLSSAVLASVEAYRIDRDTWHEDVHLLQQLRNFRFMMS